MSYRRRGYGPRYPQDTRGSIPHRNFPSRAAPPHTFAPRNNTLLRNGEDWRTWGEVSIRITGLAPFATITDIYENFTESGTISRIMFDMDRSGSRTGVAIVTFSPPPSHAFWNMEKIDIYYPSSSTKWPLELTLMDKKRTFEHPSPVNSKKFYPERIVSTVPPEVSCFVILMLTAGSRMRFPRLRVHVRARNDEDHEDRRVYT